jgi:hypothetical protein
MTSAAKEPQMLGEPGEDYPTIGSAVDLIAASRGDTLTSWTDDVQDEELLVSVPQDESQRPLALGVGEQLEVVWKGSGEVRALPVVLSAIEVGEQPRWRLRRTGVVKCGQRGDAVRAPLAVPIRLDRQPSPVTGTTVDLSEGGLRCVLETERRTAQGMPDRDDSGDFSPPEVGEVVRVSALFPDSTITCLAEVIRRHPRDDSRVELSLRFIGLREDHEDLIRRRVFARLRDLRHRGLR